MNKVNTVRTIAATLTTIGSLAGGVMGQTNLHFNGTRTAIVSGGNTVGYSFSNVFGDNSDAIIDVVFDDTTSSSWLAGDVTDDITNKTTGVTITNETGTGLTLLPKAFFDSTFHEGSVTANFNFFLHDSSNNAIGNKDFSFLTRDIDGNTDSEGKLVDESISVGSTAYNLSVADSTYLNISGNTVSSFLSDNNLDSANDPKSTAYWDENIGSDGKWTLGLSFTLQASQDANDYGWEITPSRRGFVIESVPEPSSTLLLGLGSLGLLIRRKR